MVHAKAAGTEAVVAPEDVEAQAAIEEQLIEDEEEQAAELEAEAEAEEAAAEAERETATARDSMTRPDA